MAEQCQAEMPEQEPDVAQAEEQEEEEEDKAKYKVPPPKSTQELLELDQDDESLVKYKEKLLGKKVVIDENNPSKVIMQKMIISVHERPDVELDLTLPKEKLKESKIVLKEGCQYTVRVHFYVQKEIVSGLKYKHVFRRKGISMHKESLMMGSFPPKEKLHVFSFPQDEAPKGMLSRGDYTVRSTITDDDEDKHMEWEWHLVIKKDFD